MQNIVRGIIIAMVLMFGIGCRVQPAPQTPSASDDQQSMSAPEVAARASEIVAPQLVLPVEPYLPTYKRFGEYFRDRFTGYHVAEDLEVLPDVRGDVPVRAIADGTVRYAGWVAGYGGVMVVRHDDIAAAGVAMHAIYGHLDMASVRVRAGDVVAQGEVIGVLGDDRSRETDGERRHLHFALYQGEDVRLQGYERDARAVSRWLNPADVFAQYEVTVSANTASAQYAALADPQGKDVFALDFTLPPGWDVEYISSIQALNFYRVDGGGTARERSQVLIRYFDASDFLTLSTVTIHEQYDLTVGQGSYAARRYVIEKKSEVSAFAEQPAWRNARHTVTDFRAANGPTRYYVVAANPALDGAVHEALLASMRVLR
ncbi:MAG: M23 family metallopeptidase [bacterium]|nr:M23 family metallopeptidase [bacterium]